MDYVEAFRDIKQIHAIKKYLKDHSERDFLFFVMGINSGLKLNEILEIKVHEVLDKNGTIKDFFLLPAYDQHPEKQIYLNAKIKNALAQYIQVSHLQSKDYLFFSPKTNKPITRQQAHRIIHQAVDALGIEGKYGASSMRKTFGFHAYKQGVSLSLIQKYFHHSTPSETLKYLGITKDEGIQTIIDVNL
ncbi:site-specific integrase [Peribacillus cavernae]|uniref:Site-specific integrase n=1 Tax=Peribacillus cavernae TaxID=1674310 RepID=A0A3S0VUU8_9BACI|nr:tyrosine-type recombinase/integrase [Peribacillus cavernae]MDQ0220359.1 site-specific recombinase XerD [Peribacillus cavernae]RUQ25550.1 site-specific integrase [Peribacillus cavernae]